MGRGLRGELVTEVYTQVDTEVLAEVLAATVPGLTFGDVVDVGNRVCLVRVEDDGAPESWAGRMVEYGLGRDGDAVRVISRALTIGDDGGQWSTHCALWVG
jgi:hypothetical protein